MFRQGVSALIANSRNEFLVVNLVSFEPRFFAVPGGGMEPGETRKEAVYRELEEELGIRPEQLELIGQSDTPVRFRFQVIKMNRDGQEYQGSERYFFGFRLSEEDDEIKPNREEVRSYRWVSFGSLKHYLLFDGQLTDTTAKLLELFPAVSSES